LPFVKNTSGADYVSFANEGNNTYIFVGLLSAKTVDISINENIYGKTVEVITSNNLTVNTQKVISTINITSSAEGYALLRVY
jgi:hypothetical protein